MEYARDILSEIDRLASVGKSGALASIVSASGSLPMSRRSKMLILPDGTQRGTVGGGCLEADVYALGRQVLGTGRALMCRFTLTETHAGAEGLNCGGTVRMLIEPVGAAAGEAAAEVLKGALAALEERRETVAAAWLRVQPAGDRESGEVSAAEITGRGLVGWNGWEVRNGLMARMDRLARWAEEEALGILGQDMIAICAPPDTLETEDSGDLLLLDSINAPATLYLFGGGHVALAVSRVSRAAGFRVVVVDDRAAFAAPGRFPEADETHVLPLESAVSRLPVDKNSFIVAVTRGHQHDEPVIEQAVRTPAAYIGMIGSRRKVAIMWERLKARGVTQEALDRVHAPIGLPIGGDTPGEIAVSIVAQLIEIRRSRR